MKKNGGGNLLGHSEALRSVLIKCFTALAIGIVPMFLAVPYIIDMLIKVIMADNSLKLNFFSPLELFVLQIKTAILADIAVCFPYIAKQLWSFVAPALYAKERRFVKSVIWISSGLFVGGALFCLFAVLPMVIRFGMSFVTDNIQAVWGVGNIMSFSLTAALAFGIVFQFPIIAYALISGGVLNYETVKSKRCHVFVGILVISALLTPPDIVSQLLLAFPAYGLFEIGLFFGKLASK